MGFFVIVLSACAPRSSALTATPWPSQDAIALMQTAVARVTQAAAQTQTALPSLIAPSATPIPSNTPLPTVLATIVRPSPSPAPQGPCNLIAPGTPFDVSIPDDSPLTLGQTYTKTWRVVNAGTCTWTRLYKLVFFSQNPLGAQQEQFLAAEVLPGQEIDLSIQFTVPAQPGSYQSNWILQDENGQNFGMGRNADVPFYLRILAVEAPLPSNTPKP